MAERLVFDIFAVDHASQGFVAAGKSAKAASDDVMGLARRLDEIGRKSATARVGLEGNKEALAQMDRLDLKLLALGKRTTNLKVGDLEGFARVSAQMSMLDVELDKLSAKAGKGGAAGAVGSSGLAGPGGMGALIAAGAAMSPVLLTLGTGLAGLTAAGYGVVKPIITASQATGGLQANLSKLNPEQRAVAVSLHALGQQYDVFQKQLQPQVLGLFGQGIKLAGAAMRDVEPVAAATGKALNLMLGSIGAEFAAGQWQSFFGWMAREAGPDMKLVSDNIVTLMNDLPALMKDLQPLATAFLITTRDTLGFAGALERLNTAGVNWEGQQPKLVNSSNPLAKAWGGLWSLSDHIMVNLKDTALTLTGQYHPAVKKAATFTSDFSTAADAADLAQAKLAPVTARSATSMHNAALDAQLLAQMLAASATQTTNLMNAQSTALNTQLAYGNAVLTSANDAQALRDKLKLSWGMIGLQTQAQRDSFGAAQTYIGDLSSQAVQAVKSGHGVDAAMTAIRNGLPLLDSAKTKNRQYWGEVQILVGWLDKLRQEKAISEAISVSGSGVWHITPGKIGLPGGQVGGAAGGMISGGVPGKDSVPVLAMPGEVIVPTSMVSAGAVDHLRGQLPGFAAGGVVGSYAGNVAGLGPWAAGDITATRHLIEQSVAAATLAGMKAAAAAALAGLGGGFPGGPGGGAPSANAALARSMYPAFAAIPSVWNAWNYVAMRESGWNQFARNPSSGAYGIPQALPPTKMPFAAQAAGGSNPAAQIAWMWNYMAGTYGGPIGAADHERAFNWYDGGGMLPVGASIAVNTSGRPESVLGSRAEALLEEIAGLLAEVTGLLAHGNQIAAAAPAITGAALAGSSRSQVYRQLYP